MRCSEQNVGRYGLRTLLVAILIIAAAAAARRGCPTVLIRAASAVGRNRWGLEAFALRHLPLAKNAFPSFQV